MPDLPPILGLHHVTAISSDAARTHAFYTTLGLKLVKQTVNFDDPTSLHLYYGDATGSPGSIVTLFTYDTPRGRVGAPMVTRFALTGVSDAGDEPDGLPVVARPGDGPPRLADVTLGYGRDATRSREFLDRWIGEAPVTIDEHAERGRPGAGTVHHVAFRVADREGQEALRAALVEAGVNVSPVMDRDYFTSIYFREPGGVLLEVATDGPGFATDEPADRLGQRLCLPEQYADRRAELKRVVPWIGQP